MHVSHLNFREFVKKETAWKSAEIDYSWDMKNSIFDENLIMHTQSEDVSVKFNFYKFVSPIRPGFN